MLDSKTRNAVYASLCLDQAKTDAAEALGDMSYKDCATVRRLALKAWLAWDDAGGKGQPSDYIEKVAQEIKR